MSNTGDPQEQFALRTNDAGGPPGISVNATELNTISGSKIVIEANKTKQIPSQFKSKDGSDLELRSKN